MGVPSSRLFELDLRGQLPRQQTEELPRYAVRIDNRMHEDAHALCDHGHALFPGRYVHVGAMDSTHAILRLGHTTSADKHVRLG